MVRSVQYEDKLKLQFSNKCSDKAEKLKNISKLVMILQP